MKFNSFDFLEMVRKAEESVGSPAHREFATVVARWRDGRPYLDFTDTLTTILRQAFSGPDSRIPPQLAISCIRDMVPFTVGSAWWADTGFPSIALTHDFQRSIAVTDFGDAGDDPMHMPFEAFVLRLPESLRGKDAATPMFVYPVPIGDPRDGSVDFRMYRMTIMPEPDDERQAFTQWDRSMAFNTFLSGKVRQMEDEDAIERNVTAAMGHEMDPEVTKRARRVLGNTLLYVNANGGLPPTKQTGETLAVEREHSVAPRFRVGRPIKLGPQLRDAIREGLRGGASWKLTSKFVVRGHWRNQAYGPQHSLRMRKWIEPYWKGPENIGEALERRFEVT